MKSIFLTCSFIGLTLLLSSCKTDTKTPSDAYLDSVKAAGAEDAASNTSIKGGRATRSVWENHSLVDAPTSKGKWLASIRFGEDMDFSGDTAVDEAAKRTYCKVSLSDGKSGWVRRDLIEHNAALGAISEMTSVYSRPGVSNITDESFAMGDIVVITQSKDDFTQVTGKNDGAGKRKKGWVLGSGAITSAEKDIAAAGQWARARNEADHGKRAEKLTAILSDIAFTGNIFEQAIQAERDELLTESSEGEEGDEIIDGAGEDQYGVPEDLTIKGTNINMRTQPQKGDNVVTQLQDGTACEVLLRGKQEIIDGHTDYWYQVKCKGKTGWVYGQFTDISN